MHTLTTNNCALWIVRDKFIKLTLFSQGYDLNIEHFLNTDVHLILIILIRETKGRCLQCDIWGQEKARSVVYRIMQER